MDALEYLKTVERMKKDEAISMEKWLDFYVGTPEQRIEIVETWKKDNDVIEITDRDTAAELFRIMAEGEREDDDRLIDILTKSVNSLWTTVLRLDETVQEIWEEVFLND